MKNQFIRNEDRKEKWTYNIRDSLVVADLTTSLTVAGLSKGERTGSRVFQHLLRSCMEGHGVEMVAVGRLVGG
jgi:hypothetical protein